MICLDYFIELRILYEYTNYETAFTHKAKVGISGKSHGCDDIKIHD